VPAAAPKPVLTLDGVPMAPHLAAQIELERRRRGVSGSSAERFPDFVSRVYPRFNWYPHCELIAREYQRVADGETKRLMVFAPPRSGKTLLERLFFGYYVRRYPERWCGVASYGEELARTIGRAARDNFRLAGGSVRPDVESATHWETTLGGGCWAAGVGGAITGKGMHHGGVDDPVKGAEDAASLAVQSKQQDWWQSTWYTRCEPGASLGVTMTRWDLHDLGGWLLEQEEAEDGEPEHWRILHLESIKEERPPDYPPTCTVVTDDYRKPGEALCPERYPIERLYKIRARIGDYYWSALHCQRPRAPERKHTIFAFSGRHWPQMYNEDTPQWAAKKAAARAAWTHVGGWDFGSGKSLLVNLFGVVEWTENPSNFELYVDDELAWQQTAWHQAAADSRLRLANYGGPRLHYGDPAGVAKESDQHSWQDNLQSGGVPLWCLPAVNNSTEVMEWAEKFLQYLIDSGRFHVHERCRGYREALREWKLDLPDYIKDVGQISRAYVGPRKDVHSHYCQAGLYMLNGVLLQYQERLAARSAGKANGKTRGPISGAGSQATWVQMYEQLSGLG
jgi:hypothetical protein